MTHRRLAGAVLALALLVPLGTWGSSATAVEDDPRPSATSTPPAPDLVGPTADASTTPSTTHSTTPSSDSSTTPAPEARPESDPGSSPGPNADGPSAPSAATGADEATNLPPVAVDDPEVRVEAGSSVRLDVLANDTDDGLGRPATETPHLEIAFFSPRGGRVTLDETRTVLTFIPLATDPGHRLAVRYTVSDGSLTSEPTEAARVVVAVDAPPPPPHTVQLGAPTGLVVLHTNTLGGTVSPRRPTARVWVQTWSSGAWHNLRSERVGPRGGYAARFSSDSPQRYSFRTVAVWPDGVRAVSRTMRRRVLAHSEARVSGPLTRRDVPWSYRTGCPVTPSGLRRLTINRFTYAHVVARGSLVVRASAVPDLLRVFRASFAARFPVRSMRPTDAFYDHGRRTPTGSDIAAMQADNTSAFNCRPVTGNPYRVSQHSYGNAIDINTVRNPYVVGSQVYPSWARTYLERGNVRTGMIVPGGSVARTMSANRWLWGARWTHPDYQHFSANGG